ncbi:hypothetical protein ACFL6U_09825, partial [Planctomycetota bacterium]
FEGKDMSMDIYDVLWEHVERSLANKDKLYAEVMHMIAPREKARNSPVGISPREIEIDMAKFNNTPCNTFLTDMYINYTAKKPTEKPVSVTMNKERHGANPRKRLKAKLISKGYDKAANFIIYDKDKAGYYLDPGACLLKIINITKNK